MHSGRLGFSRGVFVNFILTITEQDSVEFSYDEGMLDLIQY